MRQKDCEATVYFCVAHEYEIVEETVPSYERFPIERTKTIQSKIKPQLN